MGGTLSFDNRRLMPFSTAISSAHIFRVKHPYFSERVSSDFDNPAHALMHSPPSVHLGLRLHRHTPVRL